MNILQINNSDLIGRIFNGYDLHLALRGMGIDAYQLVMDKLSDTPSVKSLKYDKVQRANIKYIEETHGIKNVLFPYAEQLRPIKEYREADILHYHFPYHDMFSLLDYSLIMDYRSVWTLHDLWPLTGNCTHPMKCDRWMYGCGCCNYYNDSYFPMLGDNTAFMWLLKKYAYKSINPHIVVSTQYMENYVRTSPLTKHFTRIHRIPFGIEVNDFCKKKDTKIIIGFRVDDATVKGCNYFFKAIEKLKAYSKFIEIQAVGSGTIPKGLIQNFEVKRYGWITDRKKLFEIMKKWDVFVMPSLAESFGLMALEAMGCKCAVVCFENTAVAEVTEAPVYALAATYADSDDLAEKIRVCLEDKRLLSYMQNEGYAFVKRRYSFSDYVQKHIELYTSIINEQK